MLNGNAIKAFAADKITLNVTGLVTGSDIGHDCQRYLSDEYDQNYHWQRCTICDKKYNVQPHTMTPGYWTGGNAQNCRSENFFVRTCTNEHCGYETRTQAGRAGHNFSSAIYYHQYMTGYRVCTVCGESVTVCECTINGRKPGCDIEGYCDKCANITGRECSILHWLMPYMTSMAIKCMVLQKQYIMDIPLSIDVYTVEKYA